MFALLRDRLLVGEELVSDLGSDPKAQAVNQPTSAVFSGMTRWGCSPEWVGMGLWTECPPLRPPLVLPFFPLQRQKGHMSKQTPRTALLVHNFGGMTPDMLGNVPLGVHTGSPVALNDPLGNHMGTDPPAQHGSPGIHHHDLDAWHSAPNFRHFSEHLSKFRKE